MSNGPVIQTLANGIRVVVDPMPHLETAAIGVWANAGSVDEADDEHGVAHLLEHMAFKGTATRSAREIAEEIENVGGYLNAATSHQRTGYYARILAADTPLAFDILSDILTHPTFDETELEKEKEVVVQEIGEAADTPDDVVFDKLMEVTWADQPLAHCILGGAASVRAQTPDSLRGFMGRCYRPDAMVIAASGGVDPDAIIELAEARFGGWRPAPATGARAGGVFTSGVTHDDRDTEQTHFAMALPGVGSEHEDYFATRLLADVLGGGMSSRLFQIIREERGLAYSVYAFADGYERAGLLGAYIGADEANMVEASEIIRREIEALRSSVTDQEIDRARAMLRASLLMSLEQPAARIEASAGQLFTYGRILPPAEIVDRLNAVTAADIRRCADRACDGRASISIVGPADANALARVLEI